MSEFTAAEQEEYDAGIAEGYSPASMRAGIEKRRQRRATSQARPQQQQQEPIKEAHVSTTAPKELSNRWSKLGAGIGKAASGISKFIFKPGYNEDPVRFKNSGRFKHQQPKEKVVYIREVPRKQPKTKIVYVREREAPVSPFASDFQPVEQEPERRYYVPKGGVKARVPLSERNLSPFASDFQSGGGGFSSDIGGNPFASDLGHTRKKRK